MPAFGTPQNDQQPSAALLNNYNDNIHSFDYENVANQLSNDGLGSGTAARLHLIESSDELEGTPREHNFFLSIWQFYVECVRKIIARFPFTDQTISDLSMLDPCNRFYVTAASITRLVKRIAPQMIWMHYWWSCGSINHCQIASCLCITHLRSSGPAWDRRATTACWSLQKLFFHFTSYIANVYTTLHACASVNEPLNYVFHGTFHLV